LAALVAETPTIRVRLGLDGNYGWHTWIST
jgi:hypothetical protein